MKNILSKITAFFLILPNTVFAQTQTSSGTGIKSAFKVAEETASSSYNTARDLDLVLGDIILIILSSIGTVFVIFIIYAGYLWMTASGNEQKVDKSIQILKQSIIGLIIVIGAYAISYFVIQIFGSQLTQ